MKNKLKCSVYLHLSLFFSAGDRGRTGTRIAPHGILSPGRLPIPPRRHHAEKQNQQKTLYMLLRFYATRISCCLLFYPHVFPDMGP